MLIILQNKLLYYLFFIILIVNGCVQHAYDEAIKEDTIYGYNKFLTNYPDFESKSEILNRIDIIHKKNYLKYDRNDVNALETFVIEHPDNPYVNSAKQEIAIKKNKRRNELIKEKFNYAKLINTEDGYRNFVKSFPESPFTKQANELILILKDFKTYEKYKDNNDLEILYNFKKKYENNFYLYKIDERIKKIESQNFLLVKNTNTLDAYEGYIKTYPKSHNVNLANEYIKKRKELIKDLSIIIWNNQNELYNKSYHGIDSFELINKLLTKSIDKYWKGLEFNNKYYLDEIDQLKKLIPPKIQPPNYPKPISIVKDEFESSKLFKKRVIEIEKKRKIEFNKINQKYLNELNDRNAKIKKIKKYVKNIESEQKQSFEEYKKNYLKIFNEHDDRFLEFKLKEYQKIFRQVMGLPIVKFISYNADTKTVFFKIFSSNSNYELTLKANVENQVAKVMKSNPHFLNPEIQFAISGDEISIKSIKLNYGNQHFQSYVTSQIHKHRNISILIENKKIDYQLKNNFSKNQIGELNKLIDDQSEVKFEYSMFQKNNMNINHNLNYLNPEEQRQLLKIPKDTYALVLPINTFASELENLQRILYNSLKSEVSKNFNLVTESQFEKALNIAFEELEYEECNEEQCIKYIQDILQVENIFEVNVLKEKNDYQLTLSLKDLDRNYVDTIFCNSCNTQKLTSNVLNMFYRLIKNKYSNVE